VSYIELQEAARRNTRRLVLLLSEAVTLIVLELFLILRPSDNPGWTLAIASGLPVPAVYVLDHEEGMNAFAAGLTPENAAVAVTRGLLLGLDRDELQGVVDHEFAHVRNGDMRLKAHLIQRAVSRQRAFLASPPPSRR